MIVIKVFLFSLFTCFLFVILGIITGLSIFGPAVAYGLGGVFSQIYVTLEGRHNTLIQFITKIITFFTIIVNYPKRNVFVNKYQYASQILPVQRTLQLRISL